jgi:hypothetical protein
MGAKVRHNRDNGAPGPFISRISGLADSSKKCVRGASLNTLHRAAAKTTVISKRTTPAQVCASSGATAIARFVYRAASCLGKPKHDADECEGQSCPPSLPHTRRRAGQLPCAPRPRVPPMPGSNCRISLPAISFPSRKNAPGWLVSASR